MERHQAAAQAACACVQRVTTAGYGLTLPMLVCLCLGGRLPGCQVIHVVTCAGQLWSSSLSSGVLQATVGATLKLFLVCGIVGALLHSGRLSDDTAPVLSKVAFNVMLPCMLFTKVATTLANSTQRSLLAVPLIALLQVA